MNFILTGLFNTYIIYLLIFVMNHSTVFTRHQKPIDIGIKNSTYIKNILIIVAVLGKIKQYGECDFLIYLRP